MNYFKLIEGIHSPQTIDVIRSNNGYKEFGWIRLIPNEKYPLGDDKEFIKSLEDATVEKRKSTDLVKELEANNIPFSTFKSGCCGGKIEKVRYRIVDIVRDEV